MGDSAFHKSLWPEIVRRYEAGEEMKVIAEDLGIDRKTVCNVAKGSARNLLRASPVSLRRRRRTLQAIASTADSDGPSTPPPMRTSANSNQRSD